MQKVYFPFIQAMKHSIIIELRALQLYRNVLNFSYCRIQTAAFGNLGREERERDSKYTHITKNSYATHDVFFFEKEFLIRNKRFLWEFVFFSFQIRHPTPTRNKYTRRK